MVSVGNKSQLVKSEYCQKCAKCCKEYVCGGFDLDSALRFRWMSGGIIARDTDFRNDFGGIKREVVFKTPCLQLVCKEGKYSCAVWNKERPDFCNTYPDSIFYCCDIWDTIKIEKLLKESEVDCPGLSLVSVVQVQYMLTRQRGD